MSETPVNSSLHENLVLAELLPGQVLVHNLSNIVLLDSHDTAPEYGVPLVNAQEVRDNLSTTSLRDVLLRSDEPLTPDPERYRGHNHPIIVPGKDATLAGISFGTWGMNTKVAPLDQSCWSGNVHITFWYQGDDGTPSSRLGERLAIRTDHNFPGQMPTAESSIVTPSKYPYHYTSPTIWRRFDRPATDTELSIFKDIVDSLQKARQSAKALQA